MSAAKPIEPCTACNGRGGVDGPEDSFPCATCGGSGREPLKYTVAARYYGGTYLARVEGENFQASSTNCAAVAADVCAKKFCVKRNLEFMKLTQFGTCDLWILTALENV